MLTLLMILAFPLTFVDSDGVAESIETDSVCMGRMIGTTIDADTLTFVEESGSRGPYDHEDGERTIYIDPNYSRPGGSTGWVHVMSVAGEVEEPWTAMDWAVKIWVTLIILLAMSRCWDDPAEAFKVAWEAVALLVMASGAGYALLLIWT